MFSSQNLKCVYQCGNQWYNIVDDVIWEIIHEDVPVIKEYLEKILHD